MQRLLVAILVVAALALIWFGPSFAIPAKAHQATVPFPSLGTIFLAASEALSEPRRKPVAAKHRHPRPKAKAAPARPRPSQTVAKVGLRPASTPKAPESVTMAYAAEPGRATEVYNIVVRERTVPASGGQIVRASWYGGGERLNKHTANGEVFRPSGLTCAHRTLPFGTRVRVTHVGSGRSVTCRVSDRGPHKSTGRSIDLSKGSAERIGMLRQGVATVKIQVLK